MASFNSVLTQEDIDFIFSLDEVQSAKRRLDSQENGKIYFTIEITESIQSALHTKFGIYFSDITRLPMRWIKGDTLPHFDHGQSEFQNTYLVYLNDSPGEFLIGESSYPIARNTGYMFPEGVYHSTAHTDAMPRLLIGPMNEFAEPVGAPPSIYYYTNQADAENTFNAIAGNYIPNYVIGTLDYGSIGALTHWRIASSSTGTSSQSLIYANGNVLNSDGNTALYHLFPNAPCFLEGTQILCLIDGDEKYIPVEKLTKGTLVKTSLNGYKKVVAIGKGEIKNPGNDLRIEDRLYKCSSTKYPELKTDLFITGCHSILQFPLTEKQKEESIKRQGKLYVTEKKYRLMACVDERAEPWNSEGVYTIYHFALENMDERMNYGVYANGGLLVETCDIHTLLKRSNMKLL